MSDIEGATTGRDRGAPAGAAAGAFSPLPDLASSTSRAIDAAMRSGTGDARKLDAGFLGEAAGQRRGERCAHGRWPLTRRLRRRLSPPGRGEGGEVDGAAVFSFCAAASSVAAAARSLSPLGRGLG